jgi:hypothetical protein
MVLHGAPLTGFFTEPKAPATKKPTHRGAGLRIMSRGLKGAASVSNRRIP